MRKIESRTYAFSAFVFNTGTGELTRGGKRLRIPEQESRALALLLENPGSMVTREELRMALWPEEEILDYDRSINRAISQLRAILRDHSSKASELIETLPKRGYRFVATVREIRIGVPASEPTQTRDAPSPVVTQPEIEFAPIPEPLLAEIPSALQASTAAIPAVSKRSFWRRYWVVEAAVVIAFLIAVVFWLASPHPISLGIIPFETSGDGAVALAEGFRLNLADVLSQSPEIETRSVHAFDHIGQDENQILARARQMHVDALLIGKFAVSGNKCELRLELVRCKDGGHLSSLFYSGSKEELASISDRLERDIFDRLHSGGKALSLSSSRPASAKAYAAYLNGRVYLQQWTDESLTKAVASFDAALKEDPSYARADAGKASAYFVLAQHGEGKQDETLEQARKYSARALALDPTLAEAHAILGEVALTKDWNFSQAEEQLHYAVELDPNHAIYHQWLSILLGVERKYDLALSEIDKAHAANPNWAPLYMTEIFLAGSAEQQDRADRAADLLLQKMPDWSLAHEQYALYLWSAGKYAQAITEWRQAAVLEKNADRVQLEDEGEAAFRTGGVKAYAELRLRAIRTKKGLSHIDQDFISAQWYAYAGDLESAINELTVMVKDHSPNALQIADDPAYKQLRHNPRFAQLLKEIGIPSTRTVPSPS
jgi:DNA-binding winged helix-turn-helix (wHTH) protein/tetratricopeptide (TPR) repeat protein